MVSDATQMAKKHALPIQQRGSSIIEVLVAIVVLSVGLLGQASLQLMSAKNSNSSYIRTQANVMAVDIIDRMRVNTTAALAGGYAVAVGSSTIAGTSIAANDIAAWKIALAGSLPEGDGSIDSCSAGVCSVVIQWSDRPADGDAVTKSISLVSRL